VACLAAGAEDLANVAGLKSLARSVDAVIVRPWHTRVRALPSSVLVLPQTQSNERYLHFVDHTYTRKTFC
jgi:hypothetical protein